MRADPGRQAAQPGAPSALPDPAAAATRGKPLDTTAVRLSDAGIPAREVLRDLEQLVPGDALGMEAAQEWLGSDAFDRFVREVGRTYAADPGAERAHRLYAERLVPMLDPAGAKLDSFECGPGYCVGAVRGLPMPGGEDLLGDAADSGAIAVQPWEDQGRRSLRFVLASDPAVREVTGAFAGP